MSFRGCILGDRRNYRNFMMQSNKGMTADVTEPYSNVTEEFNLNAAYLQLIYFCMSEWELLNLYGINGNTVNASYYDRQIKILDTLLDLLAPKISIDLEADFDALIRYYERKSSKLFMTNTDGMMLLDRQSKIIVDRKIRQLYRALLREIQLKGMLTKISGNPNSAVMELD